MNQNYQQLKIIDSLVFGSDGISKMISSNDSIEFINSDIRETEKTKSILKNIDCVIHLAAVLLVNHYAKKFL